MIGVYLINVTKDNFLNSVMLEDFANDATITSTDDEHLFGVGMASQR